MNHKSVQQKLCTEPKDDPQEAFRFAVEYEEGISQHKAYESATKEIKSEPVYAVTERTTLVPDAGWNLAKII